ncbi:conserved hypothetical protein [Coccidioides posadasii str. Silveira]|uniref:Uncharacterized protein n=1 Tax=Coccidioides posadasii (strain RMSCC 757 / Silveira) TaxID=443226 RepID=E9CZJ4_COCPS|nr:conserved hypothetical protein [Coccidioides posadasii str. Silveira]
MDGCVGNGKKSWMETGYNPIRRKSLNITSPSHRYGVHMYPVSVWSTEYSVRSTYMNDHREPPAATEYSPVDTKVAESGLEVGLVNTDDKIAPKRQVDRYQYHVITKPWPGCQTTTIIQSCKVDVWIEPKRSSCAHKLPLGPLFCFLGLPLLPNPKIHFSDGKSGLYRLPSFPVPRTLYQRDPVST